MDDKKKKEQTKHFKMLTRLSRRMMETASPSKSCLPPVKRGCMVTKFKVLLAFRNILAERCDRGDNRGLFLKPHPSASEGDGWDLVDSGGVGEELYYIIYMEKILPMDLINKIFWIATQTASNSV